MTGDGRCRACDTPIAGVFDGPPGEWGRRRQPVQLSTRHTGRDDGGAS
ncbi:MAG: hypothetical protein R2699_09515 [Acidimicrobiales bacterium]